MKKNNFPENVCLRPWSFERVPNKMIRGLDNALIYTSTKEACLAACLNEHRFTCRSVEYNYVTLQCHLSDSDRRTTGQYVQFVDAQGVDYFENLCLKGKISKKVKEYIYIYIADVMKMFFLRGLRIIVISIREYFSSISV